MTNNDTDDDSEDLFTEPDPLSDEQKREQMEQLHDHVRLISDALAKDLDISEERREELRDVGRKLAHLPD